MRNVKSLFKQIISGLNILFFLVLVINVVMQVIFRYVLKISVPWTEEAARLMVIWMVFFGMILVQADRENIRTDYFTRKLPAIVRVTLEKVVNLASIALLLVVFKGAVAMLGHAAGVTMSAMPWLSSTVLYIPVIITVPLIVGYLGRDIFFSASEIREED